MVDQLHTFRLPLGWGRHLTLGVKLGGPSRLGRDREHTGEPNGTFPPASPGSHPRALSSCHTTTNGGLLPAPAAPPGPALGGIFRRAFREHFLNAAQCVLLLTLDPAGVRTASLAELAHTTGWPRSLVDVNVRSLVRKELVRPCRGRFLLSTRGREVLAQISDISRE